MTYSCRSGSSIRARTRHTASSGTTPASDIGSPASGGAPSWSRRPSAWWTSASPCSPASLETTGSPTSYLCYPKTLFAVSTIAAVKLIRHVGKPGALHLDGWHPVLVDQAGGGHGLITPVHHPSSAPAEAPSWPGRRVEVTAQSLSSGPGPLTRISSPLTWRHPTPDTHPGAV